MTFFKSSINLAGLFIAIFFINSNIVAQNNIFPDKEGKFSLSDLEYSYDALEPYIDSETMMIHHDKHHQGYVNKLNAALENHRLKGLSLEEVMFKVQRNSEDNNVLNNAGGHYNHSMYWKILTPGGSNSPKGKLSDAIKAKWGSFDNFVSDFSKAAGGLFGAGWAWLSVDPNGELFISITSNQDNPMMKNVVDKIGIPILCIDVWEHAYYLKYQNKRNDYISNFMKAINWDIVGKNYDSVVK